MTACKEYLSLFDSCLQDKAFNELREISTIEEQSAVVVEVTSNAVVSNNGQKQSSLISDVPERMVCTTCRCPLNNRDEQMEHYKLDWHRFNLKKRMMGLPPVTVEEFERKTGAGDMSSISGSDSDSDDEDSDDWPGKSITVPSLNTEGSDETDTVPNRLSSKVAFQNTEGQYLVVHRCVLHGKQDGEGDAVASLKTITNKSVWVILMTGGGHFAGAVFKGKEVIQHKTFHRYTVRAKRGTAQGLRDAQNRSHAPKSAGAALRRYNEAALLKDIQDLLDSWAEHLNEALVIFLRAPSYNKTTFFGGRGAPLDKKDLRIRTLPFATRRATFREVQRVHQLLSTVIIFGKDTDISTIFSPSKKVWKKAPKVTTTLNSCEEKEADEAKSSDAEVEVVETQLETVEVEVGTLHLREYEVQPSRHRRRRRKRKEENKTNEEGNSSDDISSDRNASFPKSVSNLHVGKIVSELNTGAADEQLSEVEEQVQVVPDAPPPDNSLEEMPTKNKAKRKGQSKKKQLEVDAAESWEYGLRDALYTACKMGDVGTLGRLLHLPGQTVKDESPEELGNEASLARPSPLTLVNRPLDSSGFTLLHVASAAGQKTVVTLLMDVGADPACRDHKGQSPYMVAPEKDTRNIFRKYMGDNPDKYDYSKAKVPGPLTEEIELKKTEKKKAQKAAKKQREKEQKEEKKKQELEVEEKKRFASLTDREKRALAAERRLAEQVAATGTSLSNSKRCWLCGESLLGKIPFQYLDYSFCTTRCVQAHRKANTATSITTT